MSDVQASRDPVADPHSSRAMAAHALAHVSGGQPSVRISGTGAGTEAFLRGPGDRWVRLHSGRDPVGEAARWLESSLPDGIPDFLVVVGAGLGYVLDVLESKRANVHVLALEPEPAIVPALRGRRDWEGWLREGRLTILTGPDYAGQGEAWRQVPQAESPVPVLVHPVLQRERPDAVKSAQQVAARILFDARANASSRAALAGTYLLHTLANTGVIAREGDAGALFETFPGVPAIVIGAGPSLDRNLDALATVGDRGLLIAADTTLRPLLSAGIAPHLVVASDPSDHNARHLEDLPPCETTWLVAEGSVGRAAFETFAGRSFVFRLGAHEPWPWLESLGLTRASLRAWGSVVTSAFDLAIHARCDPIIFAGLDLAFTRQRPYCRGVTWEEDWARDARHGRELTPLETTWRESLARWKLTTECGVDGTTVATAPHLQAFRNWIAEQTPVLRRRVINGTGAGILSGGTIEQQGLGEALRQVLAPESIDLPCRLRGAHEDRAPIDFTRLRRAIADAIADATGPQRSDRLRAWTGFARDIEAAAIADALEEAAQIVEPRSSAPVRATGGTPRVVGLPPSLRAIRIPIPEQAVIIRAAIDQSRVPQWVDGSEDLRIPERIVFETVSRAIEQELRAERPVAARVDQLLAALLWRFGAAPEHAAGRWRLLAAWLARQPEGSGFPSVLTGLLSRSGWPVPDPCGPFQADATRDRLETPVLGRLTPRVLTKEGVGRGVTATTYDERHALVTPYGAHQSVVIAADGSHRLLQAWPQPIVAEVAWGSEGGALAWRNGDEPVLMHRRSADADATLEPLSFQPGAAALVHEDGRAVFPSHHGGLWEWAPARGVHRLVEAPPCIGISREDGCVRLDPVSRDADDKPVRELARHAWTYSGEDRALAPLPLDARGQRWSMAVCDGWTAAAFPHADLVHLSRDRGAAFDLACPYPVAIAWAGASLIVVTCHADVLLFQDLRQTLERHQRAGEGMTHG